jgi:small conductance mechanosensitive channel
VGEKVHIGEVEGVIEAVNIRTTHIRAPSGEICIVPNGEIRVMRNYSRGRFSTADITLSVPASALREALPILVELGVEMAREMDELMEPWQVISKGGVLGPQAELTLVARARFGAGAELRPKLLAVVHERLAQEGIEAG